MKKILMLMASVLAIGNINAQLLWKISGNSLNAPSYIVGTHHLVDGSFASKINGLDDAINNVDQVYGELDMDVTSNPDSVMMMQSAMMLPDGKTIKDVLTADQFNTLNEFCKSNLGMGMDNQMLYAQMGRFTPATLNTQFSLLLYLKNHQGQFNPQNGIDTHIQKTAAQKGKRIGGLETMSFQTSVLLGSTSMERQIEQLMCTINNVEENERNAEQLTKDYLAQNLDAILALSNERKGNSCDSTPAEEETLIYGRNKNWARIIPSIIKNGPTLFVVGCLHLPGDQGVLKLLRNAGYTIEPVR